MLVSWYRWDDAPSKLGKEVMHAVAPYAGAATGLVILLGGHGNDVDLPQYSELQVVFGRPVTVPGQPAAPPSQPAGSNPPQMHY